MKECQNEIVVENISQTEQTESQIILRRSYFIFAFICIISLVIILYPDKLLQ